MDFLLLFYFRFDFPNIAFHSIFCAFRLRPAFVVGIPVAFANLRFADVIPKARFQLKPLNDIEPPSFFSMYASGEAAVNTLPAALPPGQ